MVQAILAIPQFFQAYIMLSNGSEYSSDKWFIIVGTFSVMLLAILSIFILKLSIKTTAQISQEPTNPSSSLSEEFVLSVLGLYLIFYGLSRLAVVSVSTYYSVQSTNDINYNITQSIIYLAVYIVIAILGLSLLIKSNGCATLLNKIRVAGTH